MTKCARRTSLFSSNHRRKRFLPTSSRERLVEENAVREARRLHIPIIGLIDTNADPDEIDYGIPANDDAIRSVKLLCDVAADAIIAGAGAEVTAEEMAAGAEEAQEGASDAEQVAPAEAAAEAPAEA